MVIAENLHLGTTEDLIELKGHIQELKNHSTQLRDAYMKLHPITKCLLDSFNESAGCNIKSSIGECVQTIIANIAAYTTDMELIAYELQVRG